MKRLTAVLTATLLLAAMAVLAGCSKSESEDMIEDIIGTTDTTVTDTALINKDWWLDARSVDKKNWKIVPTRWLYMTDDGKFRYIKPLMDIEIETGRYTRKNNIIDFITDDASFEIRSAEINGDTIVVKVEEGNGVFYIKGPDMALF